MHVQRVILLPAAVLGLLAVGLSMIGVLAWVTPAMDMELSRSEKVIEWPIRLDLASLACFAFATVLILTGGLKNRVSLPGRVVIFFMAMVPVATALFLVALFSTSVVEMFGWRMRVETELLWPGFGTWLTLAAALDLMVATIVVGWFGGTQWDLADASEESAVRPQEPSAKGDET